MAPKRALQNIMETQKVGGYFRIISTSKSGGGFSPKTPVPSPFP